LLLVVVVQQKSCRDCPTVVRELGSRMCRGMFRARSSFSTRRRPRSRNVA